MSHSENETEKEKEREEQTERGDRRREKERQRAIKRDSKGGWGGAETQSERCNEEKASPGCHGCGI